MDIKYVELPLNISDGQMTNQHVPFEGPPSFTQIGTFGMKIYYLATPIKAVFNSVRKVLFLESDTH
jgi:hypothetical protein